MLVELRIQHFALLEKIELSFYPGESVVTGETGSGKSLFVDALDFLRAAGYRGSCFYTGTGRNL